jgi:hypothetical protein
MSIDIDPSTYVAKLVLIFVSIVHVPFQPAHPDRKKDIATWRRDVSWAWYSHISEPIQLVEIPPTISISLIWSPSASFFPFSFHTDLPARQVECCKPCRADSFSRKCVVLWDEHKKLVNTFSLIRKSVECWPKKLLQWLRRYKSWCVRCCGPQPAFHLSQVSVNCRFPDWNLLKIYPLWIQHKTFYYYLNFKFYRISIICHCENRVLCQSWGTTVVDSCTAVWFRKTRQASTTRLYWSWSPSLTASSRNRG